MEIIIYIDRWLHGNPPSIGALEAAASLTFNVFAFHFGLMLFGLGRSASVPTFLNPKEEEAVKEHI